MVWHHVKVAHVPPRHDAYLNLDREINSRVLIVDGKLNFKLIKDVLDTCYQGYQGDTFMIDNAMVHQTLSKIFMDMDTY